ncbi:DUF2806 domain-containing protein [Sphingomonas sp. RHCKR47]|uniref:DUF2806 domain-containing protein n=1 Tax=Sphingomonas citricola TaxID=2862498 RepID=UPI001C672300|nr:DUF2806 domain-containing protein [Sphingomonas citricola]MBW6523450.1 DUF2806 domain-containing protein [Sphingomonas citricola]
MADETRSESGGALALIDQVGPERWRQKLGRIAFQIIAGSDAGVEVYAKARARLDEVEAQSTVSKMVAEAVGRKAISDPLVMERARSRYLAEALRGQENIEGVFKASLSHLDTTSEPADENSEAGLDQEWADTLSREAELASSEQLRDRLGRVLAGEIKQRGTFPRSVIRTIAELEQADIQAMANLQSFVLDDFLYTFSDKTDRPAMADMLTACGVGLISDPGAGLTATKTIRDDGTTYYIGARKSLLVRGPPAGKLTLSGLQVTRSGAAVLNLLTAIDERPLLRRIAAALAGSLTSTSIVELKSNAGEIIVTHEEPTFQS